LLTEIRRTLLNRDQSCDRERRGPELVEEWNLGEAAVTLNRAAVQSLTMACYCRSSASSGAWCDWRALP